MTSRPLHRPILWLSAARKPSYLIHMNEFRLTRGDDYISNLQNNKRLGVRVNPKLKIISLFGRLLIAGLTRKSQPTILSAGSLFDDRTWPGLGDKG